jgi:hypothetical protein
MARNRQLYRIALRGVRRINLSRRLVCWMDEIRMPRTALRIRYVRLVHVCHLLHAFLAIDNK